MLTELRIRNVAIIDTVSLSLAPGLNVLTGETGAGKSIVIEALGLLLGERASNDIVRAGQDKATVEGVFALDANSPIHRLLDERGIESGDGEIVLKREVSTAGRSRAWVNGSPVTTNVLASVGELLVLVHGQHEARGLVDTETQRNILDAWAQASRLCGDVAERWSALQDVRRDRRQLESRRDAAVTRADWLRHVVDELGGARLQPGEDVTLEEEHRRLANAGELRLHAAQLIVLLEGEDEGALRSLSQIRRVLSAAARLDATLGKFDEPLQQAEVLLEEVNRDLAHYQDALDVDPSRAAEVEQRRDLVYRLTRKHGGSIDSALRTLQDAARELDLLDTAALDLGQLAERERAAVSALGAAADKLTAARQKAARKLEKAVDRILPTLGMSEGRFHVHLEPSSEIAASGAEQVEFRVALNAGYDARALARVASGGELSRVMLALQSILARLSGVPTLIFDEVDAGIGGAVALKVGDVMRQLAEQHQLLCVTHLPQIAARAHRQVVVSKGSRGGITTADVETVVDDRRVHEVARMLGGDPESETSRQHAREMLGS